MDKNDIVINSTTINKIISDNKKLTSKQSIVLKDIYVAILDCSIMRKSKKKPYRDMFMITEQNKIKLYKIGKHNGNIYGFYFGDKLCIVFEYFMVDIVNIKKLIKEFNKGLNTDNRLLCTRLYNDIYTWLCDDIYFIIDMEKIFV